MDTIFEIDTFKLSIDIEKTKLYYSKQNNIIEDCTCADCAFYVSVLLKEPLAIFSDLSLLGVNLDKNLSSEPTGVWCVRDDNGEFIYAQHRYKLLGYILPETLLEFTYKKVEKNYNTTAVFTQEEEYVIIDLQIDKRKKV